MADTINTVPLLQARVDDRLNGEWLAGKLASTEYTGQLLKQGDTVKIQVLDAFDWASVSVDQAGGAITATDFDITTVDIVVDKANQIRKTVRTIDEIRSNLNLQKETAKAAADGLMNLYDKHFFEAVAADADTSNKVNVAGVDATTITSFITAASTNLYKNNVKDTKKWMALTPDMHGYLIESKQLDSTEIGANERRVGMVGRYQGFDIYITNKLPENVVGAYGAYNAAYFIKQMTKLDVRDAVDGFYANLIGETVYKAGAVGSAAKKLGTMTTA